MFTIKSTEHNFNNRSQEQVVKNIRSRTSKRHTLSTSSTSSWVIFPERLFVGKENADGSVSVARMRKPIYQLFPKIYTRWTVEKAGGQTKLYLKHRISFMTIIGIWIFGLQPLVAGIIGMWLTAKMAIICMAILALAYYLLMREIRINESLLLEIAQNNEMETLHNMV